MHLSRQQFHSIHLSFTSEWVRARIYCEWKKYNFFHCNLHQCAIKWMKKMLFFYPHNTRFEIFEWEAKKSVIALKKNSEKKTQKFRWSLTLCRHDTPIYTDQTYIVVVSCYTLCDRIDRIPVLVVCVLTAYCVTCSY